MKYIISFICVLAVVAIAAEVPSLQNDSDGKGWYRWVDGKKEYWQEVTTPTTNIIDRTTAPGHSTVYSNEVSYLQLGSLYAGIGVDLQNGDTQSNGNKMLAASMAKRMTGDIAGAALITADMGLLTAINEILVKSYIAEDLPTNLWWRAAKTYTNVTTTTTWVQATP